MPITKSARRALRNAERKSARNAVARKALKQSIKTFRHLKKPSLDKLNLAKSLLDKAAQRGLVHPNKAARLKRQLARLVQTNPAKVPQRIPQKASRPLPKKD